MSNYFKSPIKYNAPAFKQLLCISLALYQLQCTAQNKMLNGWFVEIQEEPRFFLDDQASVGGDKLVYLGNDSSLNLDCSIGDLTKMDVKIKNSIIHYWNFRLMSKEYRRGKDADSLFNAFVEHHVGPSDSIMSYKKKEDYRLMKYPKIFKSQRTGYEDYGRRLHFFRGNLETVYIGNHKTRFFPEGEIYVDEFVFLGGNPNDSLTYMFSIVHPQNGKELFMDVGY